MDSKGFGRKQQQSSHIFTGEDPSTVKESKKKQIRSKIQTSNVIFNDSYIENPRIKDDKKRRYLIEEKIKSESGYADDLKKPKDTVAFKRKIKDSYISNPMKIYNTEENQKYNEGQRQKYAHRVQAFNNVFGSDKCKRTLGGINRRSNMDSQMQNSDKVTNNSFNITKNAMILNKDENQQVPYYGRRQFITCSNGKSMTYY